MRWPNPAERVVLANTAWLVSGLATAGRFGWLWVVGAGLAGGLLSRRSPRLALLAFVVGVAAGQFSNIRTREQTAIALPPAYDALDVVAVTDSSLGRYADAWAVARPIAVLVGDQRREWKGPDLLLTLSTEVDLVRGGSYRITGALLQTRFEVDQVEPLASPSDPLTFAGNALRGHVLSRLDREIPEQALLAGFLVGETSGLSESDLEALRAAGLSHFVAVSGSNVAAFLLLFWIALGPLGIGPRRRGVLGLLGLFVFAVATRWEPSVVRASLMAGGVLGARVIGLALSHWVALGLGVGLAVLVSPGLVTDLGFQLSVAATSGIMIAGDSLPESLPTWLRKPLGVGLAAQVSVAPILLASFGEIPLFSPLTNLVAAPLVAAATLVSAVAILTSIDPLIDLAALGSGAVLWIGRTASWLPQLSTLPAVGLGVAVAIVIRWPRSRPPVAFATSVGLFFLLFGGSGLSGPAVAFLDVGQGDAALIATRDGRMIMIDAGPDPRQLWEALRRQRVKALDLIIATHPHDDHIGGLVGLAGRLPIGLVWFTGDRHLSATWNQIEIEMDAQGVPMQVPIVSTTVVLGDVKVQVLGPERHYEDPNDESIVVLVEGPGVSVLMTGDIEVAAQTDIGPLDVDVLKVPHHGGATSRISWLLATTPRLAVVSVGENDFGHPHPSIVGALADAGVEIQRTDQYGDIVISLEILP
ncbi:MAG: ComEC/Rec2 family competence protein [Acidimicrobiia bacterium]|nr:ComEC/Rec2 family competence protein [Acidimicrobiia bacterium]